jgi:hypothetical protein
MMYIKWQTQVKLMLHETSFDFKKNGKVTHTEVTETWKSIVNAKVVHIPEKAVEKVKNGWQTNLGT